MHCYLCYSYYIYKIRRSSFVRVTPVLQASFSLTDQLTAINTVPYQLYGRNILHDLLDQGTAIHNLILQEIPFNAILREAFLYTQISCFCHHPLDKSSSHNRRHFYHGYLVSFIYAIFIEQSKLYTRICLRVICIK